VQAARRTTLTDDVYAAVQALIMDHVIPPDERVNIDALARRLDVSPTPVREALARLEADGLVSKRPLAGYTTTPPAHPRPVRRAGGDAAGARERRRA
jgi:DNA-binding GntR family transcriptional regulator